MSRNILGDKLEVIDKLKYMSGCIDKKCRDLSANDDCETVLKQLLKLCVRTRKNCEVFEEILLREGNSVDSSPKSSNLVITLYLLDIIGEENCRKLKNDQIQKFKAELEIFTKNYLLQTGDPVFVDLYQLFCSDTRAGNVDSTENQDILRSKSGLSEISSIFDSSSTELTPEENSSPEKEDPSKEIDNKESQQSISNEISSNNDVSKDENPISSSFKKNLEAQKCEETAECIEEKKENDNEKTQNPDSLHDKKNAGTSELPIENLVDDQLTDIENEEDKPEKCIASNVDSSVVDKNNDAEKDVTVTSTDPESVEDSKKEDILPERIKESVDDKANNANSTTETQNSDDERTVSPVESLSLIDEKLDISDLNLSKRSDESQEVSTHSNNENVTKASSSEHLDSLDSKLEETSDLNKTEGQKSPGKLQGSMVSTENSSTELCDPAENDESNATFEDPSSQSTIIPKDLDDNSFGNSSLDQREEDSGNQQVFLTQLGLSKTANYEKLRTIRDELLEILSEETCREDRNGVMREDRDIFDSNSSDSSDDEEKYSDNKVAEALKELDEDSLSDFAMNSDTELESMSIEDILLYESTDTDSNAKHDYQEQPKNVQENFIPKKCSVILERRDLEKMQRELQSRPDMLASIKNTGDENSDSSSNESTDLQSDEKSGDEDAEIDRLCQLPTFGRKRRSSEEKITKRKIKRKRRSINLSGTETSDLSGYSSVSEDEIKKRRISEYDTEEDDDVPLDPNTLLTEIVCHTIHDSDSDSSTSSSNEEEKERTKRRKIEKDKTDEENKIKKEKESSWKDDPLLKGNLNVSKDNERKEKDISKRTHDCLNSDVESNEPKKIKSTKNRSRFLDPDYCESSSTDSSGDEFEEKPKIKTIKYDSDVEFVNYSTSKIINIDSEEETDDDKSQTRKKIKSVLSSKNLTEETQRAAEEERTRIKKLEEQKQMRCSQESQSTQGDTLILDESTDGTTVAVDPNLTKKLFSHQIEGVRFMWESCYLSVDNLKTFKGTGCILAHNMGLGKTFQVVTLVHTLFNHSVTNTKHVLIVCPLSTVSGWKREFQNALKMVQKTRDIRITTINNTHDRGTKCFMINKWRRDGGVFIIGYDAFSRLTKNDDSTSTREIRKALVNPGPDLVVCDEAHVLKNGDSLRTKALMEIKTRRRIALTGTPLQNNLKEYYFMVQFVKPNLLGNKGEFNRQFVNPIMNGQYEDSLEHDITLMKKRTHVLHRLLKNTVQRFEATELHKYLQNMQDYALFIQLHPLQETLYKTYIEKKKIIENEKNIKTFFSDYQILKYICSHPQLLHTMETHNSEQRSKSNVREKEVISQEPEVIDFEGVPQDWWKSHCPDDIKTQLEFGTKLQVMMAIIEEAEKIGEKVLIFTSSLVELSSVEYFLKLIGTPKCPSWKPKRDYFRMDGTVPPLIRTEMCDKFNDETNQTLRVFLMSHKVGGLGLNLTAANRVILLGANFNPSLDTQSIYRAYRFGQDKIVYIYRLLSMGTMEEKIYNRCVTKLAIASRVVDKHQITRHYKNLDLEDLYNIEIDLSLQRPAPSKPDDDVLSTILLKYECIHKYHHHQKLLENRPDEELNEEDQRKAWEEFEAMVEREKNAQNPTTSKIPEILENKWSQLHRHPAPMLPISRVMQQLTSGKNAPTQGAPWNMNQPTDASTSQVRPDFAQPGALNKLPRIPWRSDVRNRLNVHAANGVGGQSTDGATNQSYTVSINNAQGIPSTSSVIRKTGIVPKAVIPNSISHSAYGAGRLTANIQSRTGTINNMQGTSANTSVLNLTTDAAVGQTRTSNTSSVASNSISHDSRRLNIHSTNGFSNPTTSVSSNQSRTGITNKTPGISANSSVFNRSKDPRMSGVSSTVLSNSIPYAKPRFHITSIKPAADSKNSAANQTNGVPIMSDEARKALLNATAQILQNGNNVEQADSSKPVKKKSTAIGPNPLVLARLQHRKENLASNLSKAPWRTSSSDDFQRPGTSSMNTNKKINKPKVHPASNDSSNDNDVICIDLSDNTSLTTKEQLDKLIRRNVSISKTTIQKRKNENPPIIDIT